MKYFWPKGANSITPFTVFSTDFAFDELNICPMNEWKQLTPEQVARYEDICRQVKRTYQTMHPQKPMFC